MIKTFEFFSDSRNEDLSIEIVIDASQEESFVEAMDIYDSVGDSVDQRSLSPDEVRDINTKAEVLASEYGSTVYADKMADVDLDYFDDSYDRQYDTAMDMMNSADEFIGENLDD